ncbi:HPP family protein [Polynucleobacter sp. MWH-Braz-FAM2G]|uniref:HPP family protein n=1 Tax=Polynucleobacter sp. MWH-Braz-FAM2G TaxID=1855883 RepID=UPI001BFCE910|nr:HPP family protein [Polynucleobacter sp. MWH-Braz-FAM2G]QWD90191.1 HPP family protein [Polynucleobacter sp. MWH-Braz-FAM2G]
MLSIAMRLAWVSLGAMVALGLALLATKPPTSPLLLASLGGSTIFLFGLTSAPAAQPRALFGGHLISALIGIICYQLFGDALWVCLLAEVITLAALLLTQTVHPPAGANPLIMIQAHASFGHLAVVVLVGVTILAVVAALWSRLTPGKTLHYPAKWNEPSPQSTNWSVWG